MIDWYAALEVSRNADDATIKKSYRRLVLKYHPDKNPEDRDGSLQEKIRIINNAYETLSNPSKRSAWDAQANAMEQKACGVRLDVTHINIKPRMHLPKDVFMLSPIGFPDKFLRGAGNTAGFQSRDDVRDVGFTQFFEAARLFLWWLPEMNNMCLLRGLGSPPQPGGTWSFGLSPTNPAEVKLSPTETPQSCSLVATASSDLRGAFRFESAYFPGHFLAFKPPTQVLVTGTPDSTTVLDFMWLDFSVSEKFRTVGEILIQVVTDMGGDKKFVSFENVRQDVSFQRLFEAVIGRRMWEAEDFKTYFEGHWSVWDYNASKQLIRIRGPLEQLGYSLKFVREPHGVVSVFEGPGKELDQLPFDVIVHLLGVMTDSSGGDPAQVSKHLSVQMRILTILKARCVGDGHLSLPNVATLWEALENFGGSAATSDVVKLRSEILRVLGKRASTLLLKPEDESLDFNTLRTILAFPMDWDKCGPAVVKKAQKLFAVQPLDELIPFIRKTAQAKARALGECLAASAIMKVFGAPPAVAVDALEAMVSGGFGVDGAVMALQMFISRAPLESCARVVAALGEQDFKGAELKGLCENIASNSSFETLPLPALESLASACASSQVVASCILGPVYKAAAARLDSHSWSPEELARLLRALHKSSKHETARTENSSLFGRATEELLRKLPVVSSEGFIGIVTVIAELSSSQQALENAATQAVRRMSDLKPSQLLLLTEALLRIGGSNPAFIQILDYWQQSFASEEGEAAEATSVSSRRLELERQHHLSADELAKLAQILAPSAPEHGVFEALARRLAIQATRLTAAGLASVEVAFPDDGRGPSFSSRPKLLEAVREARESNSVQNRDRSRSRDARGRRM